MDTDIRQRFASLKDARVNYVVLMGHTQLPASVPEGMLLILTSDVTAVVKLLELKKVGNVDGVYTMPHGKNLVKQVHVVEKGRGVFPERWESALLGDAVYSQSIVRVPSPDRHAMSLLHYKLFHEGFLNEPGNREQRLLLADFICTRVGQMTASEYQWMSNFPR